MRPVPPLELRAPAAALLGVDAGVLIDVLAVPDDAWQACRQRLVDWLDRDVLGDGLALDEMEVVDAWGDASLALGRLQLHLRVSRASRVPGPLRRRASVRVGVAAELDETGLVAAPYSHSRLPGNRLQRRLQRTTRSLALARLDLRPRSSRWVEHLSSGVRLTQQPDTARQALFQLLHTHLVGSWWRQVGEVVGLLHAHGWTAGPGLAQDDAELAQALAHTGLEAELDWLRRELLELLAQADQARGSCSTLGTLAEGWQGSIAELLAVAEQVGQVGDGVDATAAAGGERAVAP